MNFYEKRKRLAALALAGLMGTAGSMITTAPLQVWAAPYSRADGAYRMIDGTVIDGVYARGIDVSHWKQNIDWNAVAADDVQFVMLGTRYDGQVDPYFRINAEGAHKAGIQLGAYIYSYATTTQMAEEEADFVLDLIKDYPISYPVAFDVESSVQSALSPSELSNIINAFCKKIEDAGYYPMLYANDYWLANKIDMSMVDYDVWVARYEIKHSFADPAMWQITSTGTVNGVGGNVDIDFQYKDFSGQIPANLWRTIGDKTYYYQDYTMQKDNWINDGNGWFYMDNEGQTHKGWLLKSEKYYYLDESTGKMVTGWKSLNDNWYYLNENGKMATGWTNVNGTYYYLNPDGIMQTGWFKHGDSQYYLEDSGAMASDWKSIDGAWYYFNADGAMQTGWQLVNGHYYYMEPGSGKMITGWKDDGGFTYYLSTSSGAMTTGWRQVDGAWYYFNNIGQKQAGTLILDNTMYYLDPTTGQMAANTTITLDGINYQIDENGVCTVIETPSENTEGNTEGTTSEIASEPTIIEGLDGGPGV